MSQYILIIIWLAIIYFISSVTNIYNIENIYGKKERKVKSGFVFFSILPILWWTATRESWIFDTGTYIKGFDAMPNTFSELRVYMENINKDKGFFILSIIIKMLVGNNVIAYFFVIATIQLSIVAVVFRKYSSNYVMALFLFVTTTDYISWMHNGIRQFTAVVIILAATDLMLKKKYIPLIAIILLAATIHGSALLMILVVFVVRGKPWNKKTMFAVIVISFAIAFVDKFTNLLDIMLMDTQYTNVVSDWQSWGDDGTNPIRVLIYSIPTILSLIGLRHIRSANNPIVDLACNMSVMSTILYCLSAVTSGIFIGRLPIYCSLYAMGILLPWELDNLFTLESTRIIKVIMTGGFLAFYYYQVHIAWPLF